MDMTVVAAIAVLLLGVSALVIKKRQDNDKKDK